MSLIERQIYFRQDNGAARERTDESKLTERALPFGGIPSESYISNIYNHITPAFVDHRRDATSSFSLVGLRALNMQIAKFVSLHPEWDVQGLDTGCGPGIPTEQFLNQGVNKMIGTDSSVEMINQANELHESKIKKGKLQFQVASANKELPFDDKSFHLVVASYTVLHWQDIDFSFKEIHRVLKPGGAFFLLEPHEERNDLYYRNGGSGRFFPDGIWVAEWYLGAEEDGHPVAIPTCYRRNSTINESLQEAGFILTQIRVPLPDEELSREFPQIGDKFEKAKRMVLFKAFKQNGHKLSSENDIIEEEQIIGRKK